MKRDPVRAALFLQGAAHVQREPAFGPPVDTAPELRATSAMALVVTGHPAAFTVCVGLSLRHAPADVARLSIVGPRVPGRRR